MVVRKWTQIQRLTGGLIVYRKISSRQDASSQQTVDSAVAAVDDFVNPPRSALLLLKKIDVHGNDVEDDDGNKDNDACNSFSSQ